MFKLIEFFRKRPSDKTILYWRIIFWLIIILLLWIYFNDYTINLPASLKANELYVKYSLFILWIVPILMGITGICLAKRKIVKIIQIIFWIALIFVWNNINMKESGAQTEVNKTSTNFEEITKSSEKTPINIGFWIALLSILPLLAWITWKCITEKCLKYWEKITKIRV
ncbi:MAG: hypothetical protein ACD_49C00074G0014 [uncultured bacterium (gcode 4)]|uniref:Uncharacterized protein n=1 Tax=uncultured bacterium (gcode 4) TaxID=1234023 RepID=K2AVP0_9BACT|nr:MAG: hypothetical protein ACD_49C00074G0014 [uncultured bacterium (gcode 4)]